MEAPRNRRLAALHHAVAANRRRAELARWDEFRERLQSIRPRSKAERQAQVQAMALLEQSRPA